MVLEENVEEVEHVVIQEIDLMSCETGIRDLGDSVLITIRYGSHERPGGYVAWRQTCPLVEVRLIVEIPAAEGLPGHNVIGEESGGEVAGGSLLVQTLANPGLAYQETD